MTFFSKLFGKNKSDINSKKQIDFSKEIAELINCEYEILDLNLSAEDITKLYIQEYHKLNQEGYTPIIVVTNGKLLEAIECNYEEYGGAEQFRDKILSIDCSKGEDILKDRFKGYMESYTEFNGEDTDIYGEFDDNVKANSTFSSSNSNDETLLLVKFPTANPWEIFAWIPFGGWNDCPDEESLMSVCKYWYDLYGAVPAVITSDVLQMYIPEPIKDKTVALKIAEEQYGFCSDIVEQGTDTIKSLASTLINSHIWYFWWD